MLTIALYCIIINYTAYTDESYTTGERYRSICAFSFRTEAAYDIESRLLGILEESSVSELKWQKVKDSKYKFCANKIVDFVINSLDEHDMRVDVAIWDTHDRRHDTIGRDDQTNFERMLFHLLSNSMKRRKRKSNWRVFPDEKMGIDWITVHDCLNSVGRWHYYIVSPLFCNFFSDPYYTIKRFEEIDSKLALSCQVSGLFAGISVFSQNSYEK
ncbi:MAG: hypothetical protein SWO11_00675 [Thermodesulfobacteriota bacterium]|nr:hypothetical protein [Thermodesulfobacteriota bacterium]